MRQKAITPDQSRAARALLRWKKAKLAHESGVAVSTIDYFENRHRQTRSDNVKNIRMALEVGGVRFIGLRGVELR